MKITIVGAGNSGLAMAAHLSKEGHQITLWNRSQSTISKLAVTKTIRCRGIISDDVTINKVTSDMREALEDNELIMITTPANSHKSLAELIAKNNRNSTTVILNPGRTFGAIEFKEIYDHFNRTNTVIVGETQTIIYTCRKTSDDEVNIIALKSSIPIAALGCSEGESIVDKLPRCLRSFFVQADSLIETSLGNVGMILHCAPLMLNAGWTESEDNTYKYYYDGITRTVGRFIENLDRERVLIAKTLGIDLETTRDWMMRTYHVKGNDLFECIQANDAYKTIDAPVSLKHRYIFEDVPCGLVPLEALATKLGMDTPFTTLVIDLAIKLMGVEFRHLGRNLEEFDVLLHFPSKM